jgi:hypothetical protein
MAQNAQNHEQYGILGFVMTFSKPTKVLTLIFGMKFFCAPAVPGLVLFDPLFEDFFSSQFRTVILSRSIALQASSISID